MLQVHWEKINDARFRLCNCRRGLAGASAVEGIRELDETGSILLVCGEDHLPYDRPPLSKVLWFDKIISLDDYQRTRGIAAEGKSAVVIGDGFIGSELVAACA
jgi:hypothetical protein